MNYSQQLKKWGNSSGVRLPKKVLQAAHWQHDQNVTINIHGDSITLTPVKTKASKRRLPTLKELLKDVTPEQLHGQWDWGADRGSEIIDDEYSR